SARRLDIGRYFTRGACGAGSLRIRRQGKSSQVSMDRSLSAQSMAGEQRSHDLPGDAFRWLSADIAYLKCSSLTVSAVREYMARAAGSRAIIVDLRGYPAEFVLYEIGSWLVTKATPFARITHPDLSNPGSFVWSDTMATLVPGKANYAG